MSAKGSRHRNGFAKQFKNHNEETDWRRAHKVKPFQRKNDSELLPDIEKICDEIFKTGE